MVGKADTMVLCDNLLFPISLDPTFTVMNVANVTENVTVDRREEVWKSALGWEANSYVVKVYSSNSTVKDKSLHCCVVYVHSRPDSSWEHLTTVLYEEDEMTAVDQARPFLPPRGELAD